MAVARMKKVAVVSHLALREEVTRRLQDLGMVQLRDISQEVAQSAPLEVSEERFDSVTRCLKYLDNFFTRKKGLVETFVNIKESLTPEEFEGIATGYDESSVVSACLSDEMRLSEIGQERQRLGDLAESVSAWLDMEAPLERLEDTKRVCVVVGQIATKEEEALLEASRKLPIHVERISIEGNRSSVVVWYLKDEPEAGAFSEEAQISKVSFEGLKGTPAEVVKASARRLEDLAAEEAEIHGRAQQMLGEHRKLRVLHDHLGFQVERARSTGLFAHTRTAFVVEGWAKSREVPILEENLRDLDDGVAVLSQDPSEGDNPPVILENPRIIQPFEVVTTLYGYPRYNEVDPTPLLAPFFFVFFGLALSDVGYGLGLILLSLYFIRTLNIPEGGKGLFRLLLLGGISTVFFGVLTGSWFGNLLDVLPFQSLKTFVTRAAVFDPISNPLTILALALGMGVFHVWFGVLIKMLIDIREGRVLDGLLDQGSWLVVLASVAYFVLEEASIGTSVGLVPAYVGAVLVMIGAGRRQRNLLLKPFSAIMGLYGGVGFVGDVLSYARLLALGLATGVIAMVINQIAVLPLGIPVLGVVLMLVIMIGGHAFNLLLNTLGSFVHSGRLQFVEFFTKFFEGGGKVFRPFHKEGRFTAIKG